MAGCVWPRHSFRWWSAGRHAAQVLASLMQEHGLTQAQVPEVGSQGVVSEVLAGKRQLNTRQLNTRQLNTRQLAALCRRFSVLADVLLP